MKFIEISELKTRKFQNLINDVSSNDNEIIAELEEMAIEEIKSYLMNRFDTEWIFNQKLSKRSPIIKRIVIDYILCFLWDRTNSNEKPQSLQDRCDKNTQWLRDVAKGLISPDLPRLDPKYEGTSIFQGGSEPKFNNINYLD